MLREDVRRIHGARDVDQLDDPVACELLQQPNAPCDVREALERGAVCRDEHCDGVVTPYRHDFVPEHSKAEEAKHACEM